MSSPEAKGYDDERRAGSGEGGDAQVFKQAHEDSAASLPVGTVHEVGEGSFYDVHGLCPPFGAAAVRSRTRLPGRKCLRQKDKEQVEDQRQQQAKNHASQDFRGDIARESVGEERAERGYTVAIFATVATRIPAIMTGTARGR